jgi:hypothetical protein
MGKTKLFGNWKLELKSDKKKNVKWEKGASLNGNVLLCVFNSMLFSYILFFSI